MLSPFSRSFPVGRVAAGAVVGQPKGAAPPRRSNWYSIFYCSSSSRFLFSIPTSKFSIKTQIKLDLGVSEILPLVYLDPVWGVKVVLCCREWKTIGLGVCGLRPVCSCEYWTVMDRIWVSMFCDEVWFECVGGGVRWWWFSWLRNCLSVLVMLIYLPVCELVIGVVCTVLCWWIFLDEFLAVSLCVLDFCRVFVTTNAWIFVCEISPFFCVYCWFYSVVSKNRQIVSVSVGRCL